MSIPKWIPSKGNGNYHDFPGSMKSTLWGKRGVQPSPKDLVCKRQTKEWVPLARKEARTWGLAIGRPILHAELCIHLSVQSTAHPAAYRSVCLSVGLSVTPGDCLPAWLFMSVCVYICTSIYLCLYFSFGLSINKSIHQFVFSRYVYLSLCIHPSSVSVHYCPSLPYLPHS